MKFLALCVLLLLSVLCNRTRSAALHGNEAVNPAVQVTESQPEDSDLMGPLLRTKRQSHLSVCIYCCNCCKNGKYGKSKGCGMCCRT